MAKKNQEDSEQDNIQIRIQNLKQQAEELAAGQLVSHNSADCPKAVEEQFWKNIVAFEQATWYQPFQVLKESGICLPSPDELDDSQLTTQLWGVINSLALLRVYLYHTNHLSDRGLYTELWNDCLRDELALEPGNTDYVCHIDLIGSGSEEDIHIYLKYYADKDERRQWGKEWLGEPMPDHEELPFDRDRHLPQSNLREGFRMN